MNKLLKRYIKWYLKLFNREERLYRIVWVGKRLKAKQDHWMHENPIDFENIKKEQE